MDKKKQARLTALVDAVIAGGEPLEQVAAARDLRELVDELERDRVQAARNAGATWPVIGELYGISKQAAAQRFTELPTTPRRRRR